MRVVHFTTLGDTTDNKYLAIQRHDDSDLRIPVYKEESDGVYRQTPIFFPSCTKFMHSINVKFDKHMTAKEVKKQFGQIHKTWPGHGLKRLTSKLTKKQKEAYSYQKVSAILADYGFECTWLINDWNGADFLAVDGHGDVLKIQLKSGGYEINKKFCAYKDLWMLFPNGEDCGEDWYLVKHHDLVEMAGETTKHLESVGWKKNGRCFIPCAKPIPEGLEEALKGYKLN